MAIKQIKSFHYLLETDTNQAYDKTKTYNKIVVSEYTYTARQEKFEIAQMSSVRKLSNRQATGRKTGDLKLTLPLTTSLLTNHSEIIKAGLGDLTSASSTTPVTGVTEFTITASSTSYAEGDIIQITADGHQFKHQLVVSSDGTTVTVRNGLTDAEIAHITSASTKTVKKLSKCKIMSPVQGKTFTVVLTYSDNQVEVLRGCGVSCNFDITTTGEAKFNINFMAASADYKDEFNNIYEPITGTIVSETRGKIIHYDFQSSLLYDIENIEDISLFPQKLELKIAHKLEKNELQGGLNNIVGFYTDPDFTCTANFHYNSVNRAIFSDVNEDNEDQFYFCSQPTFSFYAPHCSYVGANPADFNVYDSINVTMVTNDIEDYEPIVVLPQ